MRRNETPTGERAKALIRKIDRWILRQEDESTIDWSYQRLVDELEQLFKSLESIDAERKQRDREEAAERRAIARAEREKVATNVV